MQPSIGSGAISAMKDYIAATESDDFFSLAYQKDVRKSQKQEFFKKNGFKKIVVVTNETNLDNVSTHSEKRNIVKITDQELLRWSGDTGRLAAECDVSLIILTNNNISRIGLAKFDSIVSSCKSAVFAVHDFDNHHWVEMSFAIAAYCDVYFPAHLDNNALFGRFSPNIVSGIPCGTIQWSKSFLEARVPEMLQVKRQMGPLGKHYFYEKFRYRNQVLHTIGKHFPTVGLVTSDYHGQSALNRWREWISYKLHFIAPVFNDLPIRFFDALISGGLPLVPVSLKPYLDTLRIPEEHYLVYSATDLLEPSGIMRSAAERFDSLGSSGVLARHLYALSNFHVDASVEKIIVACESIYHRN
jgi:hypothetical protein